MAQDIKIKRSSVPGKTPEVSALQLGELATNTYDGKLFIKQDNGTETIIDLTSPLWSNIQNKPDPTITVSLSGDITGSGFVTLTDLASGTINIDSTVDADLLASFIKYVKGTDVPTDPTIGTIWYNWNNGKHYVYTTDGSTNYWLDLNAGSSGSSVILNESSVITVTDSNVKTYDFNYNINFIQVYINRLKLRKSEFTATNSSSITINIELYVNDEIEFVTV